MHNDPSTPLPYAHRELPSTRQRLAIRFWAVALVISAGLFAVVVHLLKPTFAQQFNSASIALERSRLLDHPADANRLVIRIQDTTITGPGLNPDWMDFAPRALGFSPALDATLFIGTLDCDAGQSHPVVVDLSVLSTSNVSSSNVSSTPGSALLTASSLTLACTPLLNVPGRSITPLATFQHSAEVFEAVASADKRTARFRIVLDGQDRHYAIRLDPTGRIRVERDASAEPASPK